jgi:hypothetical protein
MAEERKSKAATVRYALVPPHSGWVHHRELASLNNWLSGSPLLSGRTPFMRGLPASSSLAGLRSVKSGTAVPLEFNSTNRGGALGFRQHGNVDTHAHGPSLVTFVESSLGYHVIPGSLSSE